MPTSPREKTPEPAESVEGSGLWTVEDLAVELRCTPRAARRLCQRRQIPGARRVGGRWLVHPGAFHDGFRAREDRPRPLLRLQSSNLGGDALARAFRAS